MPLGLASRNGRSNSRSRARGEVHLPEEPRRVSRRTRLTDPNLSLRSGPSRTSPLVKWSPVCARVFPCGGLRRGHLWCGVGFWELRHRFAFSPASVERRRFRHHVAPFKVAISDGPIPDAAEVHRLPRRNVFRHLGMLAQFWCVPQALLPGPESSEFRSEEPPPPGHGIVDCWRRQRFACDLGVGVNTFPEVLVTVLAPVPIEGLRR